VGVAFTIDAHGAGSALDRLGVSRGALVELHVAEAAVTSG